MNDVGKIAKTFRETLPYSRKKEGKKAKSTLVKTSLFHQQEGKRQRTQQFSPANEGVCRKKSQQLLIRKVSAGEGGTIIGESSHGVKGEYRAITDCNEVVAEKRGQWSKKMSDHSREGKSGAGREKENQQKKLAEGGGGKGKRGLPNKKRFPASGGFEKGSTREENMLAPSLGARELEKGE